MGRWTRLVFAGVGCVTPGSPRPRCDRWIQSEPGVSWTRRSCNRKAIDGGNIWSSSLVQQTELSTDPATQIFSQTRHRDLAVHGIKTRPPAAPVCQVNSRALTS
ncbi:hypothetical protein THIX_10392 [Thiomonas sp. X19]|nr:hypothetical protein THIX_10392 [Thiomonas sp. X19]